MINVRDYVEKLSNDNKKHIIAELDVDTAAELPSQEWDGYFLEMGSIAHEIRTGAWYSIDSEGTWYNQDGTGAYSDNAEQAAALNLSSNLNINSPSVLPREPSLEDEVTDDEVLRDNESS